MSRAKVLRTRKKSVNDCKPSEGKSSLNARAHQVDRPLEHPHDELDLPRALLRVLARRDEVERRSAIRIISEDDLLPRDGLGLDMRGGNRRVQTEFSAPLEGGFEAGDSGIENPFRRTQIAVAKISATLASL
jgi:hypothetical protein